MKMPSFPKWPFKIEANMTMKSCRNATLCHSGRIRKALLHGRQGVLSHVSISLCSHSRPYGQFASHASSSNNNQQDEDKDVIPQGVIEDIINSNPESIQRITDAANRVAELQLEQQRLEGELQSLQDDSSESREKKARAEAAEMMADAEVQAAELMLKAAELASAQVDAERMEQVDEINKIESIKSGVFSAVGGSLATIPFFFTVSDSSTGGKIEVLANFAAVAVCSFLFGVVYRYAVRSDKGNSQLKGGVVGAFGLVRGLSLAQGIVEAGSAGFTTMPGMDVLGHAAISMGQSMILFGFCSVALEFASSKNWVEIDAIQ